ncbi:tetratricopeptide repeat protein [Streptomyces achromogenes]|uniref:tetratricopeptide repeat protein n=1 Tax=Streptomyces achromogenes TaxID=67255 RepID=UPI00358E0513
MPHALRRVALCRRQADTKITIYSWSIGRDSVIWYGESSRLGRRHRPAGDGPGECSTQRQQRRLVPLPLAGGGRAGGHDRGDDADGGPVAERFGQQVGDVADGGGGPCNTGDLAGAEEQVARVRQMCTAKLGADHPYTITISCDLARVLTVADRSEEAHTLAAQVLPTVVRVLGDANTHPTTARTRSYPAELRS